MIGGLRQRTDFGLIKIEIIIHHCILSQQSLLVLMDRHILLRMSCSPGAYYQVLNSRLEFRFQYYQAQFLLDYLQLVFLNYYL